MLTNLGGGVEERNGAAEELNCGVTPAPERGHGGEVLISAARAGGWWAGKWQCHWGRLGVVPFKFSRGGGERVKGIEVQQIIVRGCASKKCSLLLGQSREREREDAGWEERTNFVGVLPFSTGVAGKVSHKGDALAQKASHPFLLESSTHTYEVYELNL